MKKTGTSCMQSATTWSKMESLSAALFGAAAILFVCSGEAKAANVGDGPDAGLEAQEPATSGEITSVSLPVPLPMARPVQPGEVALVGVGAIAQEYAEFQSAVQEGISSSLGTPREVRRILGNLRYSEPGSVAQAWLAHRGLVAASDPAFIEGVRRAVARHGAISALEQLTGRGSFARNIHGADSAVTAVISAIGVDNRHLSELRGHFMTAAHTFQGNRYGMIDKPSQGVSTDFADAGTIAEGTETVGAESSDQLTARLGDFSPISPAYAYASPLMERVLAYGARHLIATSLQTEVQTSELAPPARRTTSCLNWAQLNLNQCIAAAHFPSEEAWCAGTHAIEDVRACWVGVLPKADR